MGKNIIRECSDPDFEFYFDGDMFSKERGDFGYTLFIVTDDYFGYSHHYNSFLNKEDFESIKEEVTSVLTNFYDKAAGYNDAYNSYKEIMEDYKLSFNPRDCKRIKDLANKEDFESPETISAYLTIKTGKRWEVYSSYGVCQGDYAKIIYCPDFYKKEELNIISDLFWGMGREFRILFDGDEDNAVYGYYIADCEYKNYTEIKSYFCKMEGLEEDDTVLEVISGSHTYTKYDYETV